MAQKEKDQLTNNSTKKTQCRNMNTKLQELQQKPGVILG